MFDEITQTLQSNYAIILNEYLRLQQNNIKSDYKTNTNDKLHHGSWDWNSYVLKGERMADFAMYCPVTSEILESFQQPRLMLNTPFSFSFFSKLGPKGKIDAHYGPCNLVSSDGDCCMC